ncbi:MAG: AMP-binding protein [Actinobacteria bacterium]|nr:AMP-binding protein [Actinomycetota bacterium]
MTVNPVGGKRKIGSVGLPILGVGLKIMDDEGKELPVDTVGEVCAKGANIMKGYFKREEESKKSFHGEWFRTFVPIKKVFTTGVFKIHFPLTHTVLAQPRHGPAPFSAIIGSDNNSH